MAATVRVRRVDDSGIWLYSVSDRPVDVHIGGRRVWTFWTRRDTESVGPEASPARRVAWQGQLRKHLNGHTRLEVRDSATGAVFFSREVTLGDGTGEIEVRNEDGVELATDKSGKLVPTFEGRSGADIAALLDATEMVLDALRETGIEPFLAYGTLLGAVREGAVLGHDSDADLGYVSRFTDPVDVIRESFRVQRELALRGWRTSRYSGGAFKVFVTEGGVTRGLDVFGGFLDRGRLVLMGEIGTEFEREWIFPLGSCELEGRQMPVPAVPEKLLEATYGPGWKVPDPAFKFETPVRTVRALDEWFRGTQPGLRLWERRVRAAPKAVGKQPSLLARQAAEAAQELDAEVLDVGAGHGSDALWLARQGLTVTAYDFAPRALVPAREAAERDGLRLAVRYLNLTELRSTLAEGTRLAHDPKPRVVLARHVFDATSGPGRESLARLCSMALRGGGQLLADVFLDEEDDTAELGRPPWMVGHPDAEAVTTLLKDHGAARVTVRRLPNRKRPTVRLRGVWSDAGQDASSGNDGGRGEAAGAAGR